METLRAGCKAHFERGAEKASDVIGAAAKVAWTTRPIR
jgi:hypothetical protein